MISRLKEPTSPNFFFLTYTQHFQVENLIAVPTYFIQPSFIEPRKPLSNSARRAGWVGCNILFAKIPEVGKIPIVVNSVISDKNDIKEKWQKTSFLKEAKSMQVRGWTLDILNCIEALKDPIFTLKQLYAFEAKLALSHPTNKHIKDKIRQQLQVLRDRGLINFISPGVYRYTKIL